jgi:hypothetical protein
MQPLHVQIEVNCVKLEVVGTYYPGERANWDSPGESASIEIDALLTAKGDDISGLLEYSEMLSDSIYDAAMQAHKDRNEWAACEAAIERKERLQEGA